MRVNEYNSLQDFIAEYTGGEKMYWDDGTVHYIGIEFMYNGVYYRMCGHPCLEKDFPILPNGKKGKYTVLIMHCKKQHYPGYDFYESIGWYADMDDLLENCIIQGKKFRDVIMDDSTEILSKD